MSSMNVMGAQPQGYIADAVIAYVNTQVIRASVGTLIFLCGYNSGPDQFIQVHNKATVPANTNVPDIILAVPAASNFSFVIPVGGFPLSTGIAVCNSTTGPTCTLGAADCWFTWAH